MTIEYKDSKRISALSTNGSGTTVTESSINDVSHFEGTVGANYVIGEQITVSWKNHYKFIILSISIIIRFRWNRYNIYFWHLE